MRSVLKYFFVTCAAVTLIAAGGAVVLFSGVYNFAADDEHSPIVSSMIAKARDASIKSRANAIEVPALDRTGMVTAGAGNYQAMCSQCHLSPGLKDTELSVGLYPKPPNLSRATIDPARAFWTIKHGVKASGMPAWGRSMPDEDIWNMVAFLQQMPTLDSAAYRQLVSKSAGHAHGKETAVEADMRDAMGRNVAPADALHHAP